MQQPAPATLVHQVPGGQSGQEQPATEGAGGDWDEEERKSASRAYGSPTPGVENLGVPAASVFAPTQLPNAGAGEGDGGEFNSPRRGDEILITAW